MYLRNIFLYWLNKEKNHSYTSQYHPKLKYFKNAEESKAFNNAEKAVMKIKVINKIAVFLEKSTPIFLSFESNNLPNP